MEELNKTQVILLTIFITFVTSIATGVVTVTLMDQSPPGITQTINRVVEKTIEKVASPAEVKEVRVIVKEGQLIADAIKMAKSSMVKIIPFSVDVAKSSDQEKLSQNTSVGSENKSLEKEFTPSDLTASIVTAPLFTVSADEPGIGLIISADGIVLTTANISIGKNYTIILEDRREFKAEGVYSTLDGSLNLLKINKDELVKIKVLPVAKLSSNKPQLGQTVVGLGFDGVGYSAKIGIVAKVSDNEKLNSNLDTNLVLDNNNIGGPVINSDGEVMGFVVTKDKVVQTGLINEVVQAYIKNQIPLPAISN